MKLGHPNDEINYVGTEGTVSTYLVMLEGQPTLLVACDIADKNRTIRISAPGGAFQDTKGQFKVKTELVEDVNGLPHSAVVKVDEKSVYTYVLSRLYVLLGRLLRAATAA